MTVAEVSRMPKVTLYVKDADGPIWERARQLAGDSLSAIVSRALAAYVDEQEAKARAETALEKAATQFTIDVLPDDGPNRKIRFTGVQAHEGSDRHSDPDAYVTRSGKVILAYKDGLFCNRAVVLDSYDDFVDVAPENPELNAAVAQVLGEEWIEEID